MNPQKENKDYKNFLKIMKDLKKVELDLKEKNKRNKRKKRIFNFIFWGIVIFLIVLFSFNSNFDGEKFISGEAVKIISQKNIDLTKFVNFYRENFFDKIKLKNSIDLYGYHKVILENDTLGIKKEGYEVYHTKKPVNTSLRGLGIVLSGSNIPVEVVYSSNSWGYDVLKEIGSLVLFLLFFGLMLKFMMPKGPGHGLPFGFKVGKQVTNRKSTVKFSDVAGMEEVKEELREIVDYLKNPKKYKEVGARHPKGVLLYGPPGSGKTLLAKAVAGESNVAFFSASGSEFMEMLVGMGAAKVRELFSKAKAAGKAIIFIDEIDVIGRKRGVGYSGGHQEQEQTLNQLLTEMDGFDSQKENIVVIAATNRLDILDPALLRSGRFDRKIMVPPPTLEERKLIFEYYLKDKKVDKNIDIDSFVRRTSGMVGADIENIVNEAALKVAKEGRKVIKNEDLEYAFEKIIMGPEKKIKSLNEIERKTIALHELGHAVCMYYLPSLDNVEKITIVRRGYALGVTISTPQEERYLYSKKYLFEEMVSLLGGRAAEEVFLGKDNITTGASNDFQKAKKIVYNMITKYGMDEEIGPIWLANGYEEFDTSMTKTYSEETAKLIDEKIKKYVDKAYKEALKIVKSNKKLIEEILLPELLKKEYLNKEEFENLIKNYEVKNKRDI